MRADEDDDIPVDQTAPAAPYPWERPPIARAVKSILVSVEAPPVDERTMLALQRIYYRRNMFGGDGQGHLVITLRCILESEGNQDALIEPVVTAVSSCLRPEWIERGGELLETFDGISLIGILETMRGLDLFRERTIGLHMGTVLHNKLHRIFSPAVAEAVKRPRKERLKAEKASTDAKRMAMIERNLALGNELLALREATPGNAQFGQVRSRFDVDQKTASQVMRVARLYATRSEIYRAVSWRTLIELASPKLPPAVRQRHEAKVLAGETVTAPQIRRVRGPFKGGSPKRRSADQPARIAA